MASRLWLIAPLLVVVALASLVLFAGFGLLLWRVLSSLFSSWTGGYCPHPLC